MFDALKNTLSGVWDKFMSAFNAVKDKIGQGYTYVKDSIVKPTYDKGNDIVTTVYGDVKSVFTGTKETVLHLGDDLEGTVKGAWQGVEGSITAAEGALGSLTMPLAIGGGLLAIYLISSKK